MNLGILDYSFLVGVHTKKKAKQQINYVTGTKFYPCYKRTYGGVLSYDGEEIYVFGIIDILTTYNLRKKSENFAKRLLLSETQKVRLLIYLIYDQFIF